MPLFPSLVTTGPLTHIQSSGRATSQQASASHLTASHCSRLLSSQVDNVARMLRYIQPTGDEISLDFLIKSSETQDFLNKLKEAKMGPATILNYIKNMIRFTRYMKTHLNLAAADPFFHTKCQSYIDLLDTLRKPVAKAQSRVVCKIRSAVHLPAVSFHF